MNLRRATPLVLARFLFVTALDSVAAEPAIRQLRESKDLTQVKAIRRIRRKLNPNAA